MKTTTADVKFDERGLAPAVVQDSETRQVLMLAYMNAESLQRTLDTGETWFWSRSRGELWHKGETSGNTQRVVDIVLDCDGDTLVIKVAPAGPACHTGETSCFHNVIQAATDSSRGAGDLGDVLSGLYSLVEERKQKRPEGSYTSYLFDQGLDKILKKVGEESAETMIAAKNEDRNELAKESCDLLYHLIVLLVERGVGLTDLRDELVRRRGE
jgi:phosphoribosyl-AMP cyclohydrolase / phosphoribosyl-ATP pyrophosphohydrolase